MSNERLAIGTIVILSSLIVLLMFFATSFVALQSINPIAALIAITVALIGIALFKKTNQ